MIAHKPERTAMPRRCERRWLRRHPRCPLPPRGVPIRRRTPLGARRKRIVAQGDLDQFQWETILRFYDGLCAYCLERPGLEVEHVIPISKGGVHTASNVVPACRQCNGHKGTTIWILKRLHQFMRKGSE